MKFIRNIFKHRRPFRRPVPIKRLDPQKDIGRRAIHICSDTVGTIISESVHPEHDRWNGTVMERKDGTQAGGHRHYFIVEGGEFSGDRLFDEMKKKFPQLNDNR